MLLRRLLRSRAPRPTVERHPDELPKRGLFTEPIRTTRLEALEVEPTTAGRARVTFLVEVRDSEDRRCPDLAVDATLTGPERTATVQAATDMLGRARFRMEGPHGHYHLRLDLIAAYGLDWDPAAGPREATAEVR